MEKVAEGRKPEGRKPCQKGLSKTMREKLPC